MSGFPSLLYLGNPPVGNTTGGAGLLCRLLELYPREKLAVVWADEESVVPDGSLAGARCPLLRLPPWLFKLKSPRVDTVYALSYCLLGSLWGRRVLKQLEDWRPEAILSVTHGWLWDSAAQLAARLQVPLHLIHHDHWTVTVPVPRSYRAWAGRRWAAACRQAASNFCVSDGMMDEVAATGAGRKTLLLPTSSRGRFDQLPSLIRKGAERRLVFGYAGTMQTAGHLEVVKKFARLVTGRGHSMRFYTPYDEVYWQTHLGESYREGMCGGFVTGSEVPDRLNQETDAVLLPLSFNPADMDNMRVSFPCKTCDYCASARPVIAWVPGASAAGRWAARHRDTVLYADLLDDQVVEQFVEQLEDSVFRQNLGRKTFELGRECFSVEKAFETFSAEIVTSMIR